jgi:hypothetical protein
LPATALNLPINIPVTYTTSPTYLPDAPFVSRLYGESSVTGIRRTARRTSTSCSVVRARVATSVTSV